MNLTFRQDINIKTAMRDFCGPGKRIPSEVITHLEADIEAAKSSGDRHHKKELKRTYVAFADQGATINMKPG